MRRRGSVFAGPFRVGSGRRVLPARSRFPFVGSQADPVGRCIHIEPNARVPPGPEDARRDCCCEWGFFLRRTARFPLASGPKGAAHSFRCLRCLPGVSSRLNTGCLSPYLQMVTGFPVFTVLFSQNYGTRKIPASPNRPDRPCPLPFWAVMRADSAELIPGYTVKRRICRDAQPPRRLPWAFCQPFTRVRT